MTECRPLFLLSLLIVCNSLSIAPAQQTPLPPSVTLDRSIHLLTPTGDDVIVEPGTYEVEAAAPWLKLIPGERRDAVLVQSQPTKHDETIETPVALSIAIAEDQHHLVLLLPGGRALDAVGSYSGVRSRATVQPTLNKTAISQALSAKPSTQAATQPSVQIAPPALAGAEVQVLGAPAPPVLMSPPPGHIFTSIGPLTFSWRHGAATLPVDTYYYLQVWEAGDGGERTALFSRQTGRVNGVPQTEALNIGIPETFLGKELRWNVRACAPNRNAPRTFQGNFPIACSESESRSLSIRFPAPRLVSPQGKSSVRPVITIDGYSINAERVLYCIALVGLTCPTSPTSGADTVVLEFRREQHFSPFTWPTPLTQFAGKTVHWTAAACHPTTGCVWAQPTQVQIVPDPPVPILLGPDDFRWTESPLHTFAWSVPAEQGSNVTHYKFCLNAGADCSSARSGAVAVIRETRRTSFQMNVRDHGPPGWAAWANVWTVGACNEIGCSWPPRSAMKTVFILGLPKQPILRNPPEFVFRQVEEVQLTWSRADDFRNSDAAHFVPCLRGLNTTCETGNEIVNARIPNVSPEQTRGPSNYRCELHGTYPEGSSMEKTWQVGACNDVWGCVWSPSARVRFQIPASRERPPAQRLTCPRVPIPGLPYP
jgi:hypothetical protein